jgi:membrane protein DedA with SNARE-associated domain
VDLLGVLGLAGLLFVKEAGVPIPVPGDLLVLGAGVAAASSPETALPVLAAILLAGYVGGTLQFLLVRGTLRRAFLSMLARVGVPAQRVEAIASRLRRTGARGVAVARITPGVRVGAIAASGIAGLAAGPFVAGLVAGNTVFVGAHFGLGFAVGPAALGLVERFGVLAMAVVVLALAVLGGIGWLALRRRTSAATASREPLLAALPAWADAACPACLGLATLRGRD